MHLSYSPYEAIDLHLSCSPCIAIDLHLSCSPCGVISGPLTLSILGMKIMAHDQGKEKNFKFSFHSSRLPD